MTNTQITPETLLIIDKAKHFKVAILKRNIRRHLNKEYDWKVSRALSNSEEITEQDKTYRNRVLAEFNRRIIFLENASTLQEINMVSLTF